MTAKAFQQVARALADPQRFAILERIAAESTALPCKTLVRELAISQATVSHHLKELAAAGLIDVTREAQSAFLTIQRSTIDAYQLELAARMRCDR